MWILIAVFCLAALLLLITYLCFVKAFRRETENAAEEFPLPPGKIYEPYRDQMIAWMKEMRALPHETIAVTSHDGLTLVGNYYEYSPDSPIELMFPGYRGLAERDLCGGVQRCFALGHSALVVDQRACGKSEGNVITFGAKESIDCHTWLRYLTKRFGMSRPVILCGISMGAATVLLAASQPLPPSVVGVLADCGYTTAAEMIQKTIREMRLSPTLAYPFVQAGARLWGGFDLADAAPLHTISGCRVPVIFFHGENDAYVPCEMSRRNFEACTAPKQLVTTAGAGHGLCYPADTEGYLQALREFEEQWWHTATATK